jgi:hypothetical protein
MYTISEKTRQMLLDTFNENENLEIEYHPNSKTTKEIEKDYLAEKLNNLNIEIPSKLLFSTMSGIEEQILRCDSDTNHSSNNYGFFGYYSRVLSPEEKSEREGTLKSLLAQEELNDISEYTGKKLEVPPVIEYISIDKFLIINTETTNPN